MSQANRPNFPPGVIEALKRGDKIEAIKLLRQVSKMGLAETKALVDAMAAQNPKVAAAKAQAVQAIAAAAHQPSIKIHHHVPAHYVPHSKSGLSPGEVPHSGGQFGWVFVLLIGVAVFIVLMS